MSNKIQKKQSIKINEICYGHHGQISVILQQIRYYFLYKDSFCYDEEQVLLNAVCCNLKHFFNLTENVNQKNCERRFFSYEKNTYGYYKEKIYRKESHKKMFLDLLTSQTLLIKEYEKNLYNGCDNLFNKPISEIILESKECENAIKAQINV